MTPVVKSNPQTSQNRLSSAFTAEQCSQTCVAAGASPVVVFGAPDGGVDTGTAGDAAGDTPAPPDPPDIGMPQTSQ
ncbi:hypothetical protein GCM10025883_33710 [Mobilicoccus caccae]|uniref:Uncharacterized protein n=1 Tax=Mobilicoccus caccae TaxID=1859295 RepID=A0ABQ6IW87_9MICO|nr:hypothetical protein GCM10025883_33710 [Mobilicoccus caccae]